MDSDELPIPSIEDLTHRTQKISCADNRLPITIPKQNPAQQSLLLIGKLISHRNFHAPIIFDIVNKAWKPSRRIQVKKIERNTFVFTFDHEADRDLAFNRRPWTIRGAHLILKIWNPELASSEIDFSRSPFWVQIHGLPPAWFNKENVELIGGKAGLVLEIDFSEDTRYHWKRFVRCRVNVNISEPLCPGIFLPRNDRNDIWISLKYERLPEFCFRCGVIGHCDSLCDSVQTLLSNEFGFMFPAYGEWMKIDNDKVPPGIYIKPPVVLHCNVPVTAVEECGSTDIAALKIKQTQPSQISNFSDLEAQADPSHSTSSIVDLAPPSQISNLADLETQAQTNPTHTATPLMAQIPSPNQKLTQHKPNDLQNVSPSSFLSPISAAEDHKRKQHPDSPEYQLNAYRLEKKAKKDARSSQFGGFHLPGAVVIEEGPNQPPPAL